MCMSHLQYRRFRRRIGCEFVNISNRFFKFPNSALAHQQLIQPFKHILGIIFDHKLPLFFRAIDGNPRAKALPQLLLRGIKIV